MCMCMCMCMYVYIHMYIYIYIYIALPAWRHGDRLVCDRLMLSMCLCVLLFACCFVDDVCFAWRGTSLR